MSQDFSDVCRQGYVRHKTKKLPTWNKRWFILCKRSSKGRPRIEKYTDERSAQLRDDPKSVELLAVKNAVRCPAMFKKYAVSIEFKEGNNDLLFCLESDYDADEWLKHILAVCSRDSDLPRVVAASCHDVADNASVFPVYLLPTPMLACYGECLMAITDDELILRHLDEYPQPNKEIANWKLSTLRRYGRDDNKFMFECGRASKTGEGLFIFNTLDGESIYWTVHSATLAIASAHKLARTPQSRTSASFSHSLSHDGAPQTPERRFTAIALRSTKSSPADRAPLPLPRLDPQRPKARAPSPPPTFDPLPDQPDARARAPSPPVDSDDDKDDYEILATAVSDSVRPSFPIRSVDSMLSVGDHSAQYLTPTRAADSPLRTAPDAALDTAFRNAQSTAAARGGSSTEMNNNEVVEGAAAAGGRDIANDTQTEEIYEEKYLEAPFLKFLQLRKEDSGSEVQFV